VAGVLALLAPARARADSAPANPGNPVTPVTVTTDALPTVQINGVVWSQVTVGDNVYAAGKFTRARPAGAAAGVSEVVRNNMLSYNIRNGVLNAGFTPNLNGQALVVAASPNGARVYVGGNFTGANGQVRNRIAAYDTATGALVSTFAPSVNGSVRAIAATNDTVYLGGDFTAVGSAARNKLAAVSATNGAVLSWAPEPGIGSTAGNRNGNTATSNSVLALVVTAGGTQVVAAGRFDTLNGIRSTGVGALDPVSGATRAFAIGRMLTNQGANSAIWSLATDGTDVYGTAYDYFGPGNLEGSFRVRANDGTVLAINDCKGDHYSVFPRNGVAYLAGHPHDCGNIGGYPEQEPRFSERATAVSVAPAGVVGPNAFGNGAFRGSPAPALLPWFPAMTAGTYTGQNQAAWNITGNDQYLSYGGEFPRVGGTNQQGLVRFAVRSLAPNKRGPVGNQLTATVTATAPGTVRVAWTTSSDEDNENLLYKVSRDKTANVVHQTTIASTWWNRPPGGFTDTGVPAGSHQYRVTAQDPLGNIVGTAWTTVDVTAGPAVRPYAAAVRADGAEHHWPLQETSGTTASDYVGAADLLMGAGVTRGQAGAITGDPDPAYGFSGTSTGFGATQAAVKAPAAFSVEGWFRTVSNAGGKIIGFGNRLSGNSSTFDRQLYVTTDGRLAFGVRTASGVVTLQTSASVLGTTWHHAVGTLGPAGMSLYLDGRSVDTQASATIPTSYNGYWRIGGDATGSGVGYLNGSIDEPAVYPAALSAAQVSAHYSLGAGSVPANQPPTASFTDSKSGLTASVNGSGSSDPENAKLSYAWAFGDGGTATGPTATHDYAAAGSYEITLTVSDPGGLSDTEKRTVAVAEPPPGPSAFGADAFGRTVASGWGTADTGGNWSVTGTGSSSSVSGGGGHLQVAAAGQSATAMLNSVSRLDVAVQTEISLPTAPTGGGTQAKLAARRVGGNQYQAVVRFVPTSGQVTLTLQRVVSGTATTVGAAVTLPGTYTPGTVLVVRFDVAGGGTATLRAKAWAQGSAEPAGWHNTATDTTSALQVAGSIGIAMYASGTSTAPLGVDIDDFWAGPTGTTPAP
jgi:PKD repeat protein